MTERVRLRLSARSVVVAVLVIVLGISALAVLGASTRVLGWVVVAAIVAGLLHPIVTWFSRWLPRPLALLITILVLVAAIAGLIYGSVDEIQTQAARLERAAPDAAEELERSERFGEAAREFQLAERVTEFVEGIPERLRGGDTATAIRSAATRGVAYLATSVLTLFLILHGPGIVTAGLRQVSDLERRAHLNAVLAAGYGRAWRYTMLTLGRAVLAGSFAYLVCWVTDVPGRFLLALWVASFSVIPLLGVVTGSLAIVLLSVTVDPGATPWIAAVFVAYQVFEVLVIQRRLERVSVHVGPAVTLLAAMVGLELYGIGGMIGLVVISVLAAGVLVELAPGDDDALDLADLVALVDDGEDLEPLEDVGSGAAQPLGAIDPAARTPADRPPIDG